MQQYSHILAIDPGTEESGWVYYGLAEDRPVEHGINENLEMFQVIRQFKTRDAVMAIEMVGHFGKDITPGKSTFETCVWIGEFKHLWRPYPYQQITRREVKINICGSMKAKDKNITQALKDRFGGSEHAVGGVRCSKCKGKGWFGAGRPVCPRCNGSKWDTPPGPLHGITSHRWSALAIALTYKDNFITPNLPLQPRQNEITFEDDEFNISFI